MPRDFKKINPHALKPGTVLHAPGQTYTITECIASGGCAITYAATTEIRHGNISLSATFAIKELFVRGECRRLDSGDVVFPGDIEEQVRKDFRYEATKLSSLSHPDIVKVNECFADHGTIYYVMERLEGMTLTEYIAEKGPLSELTAYDILSPVIKAVEYIHSQKLLHLDLTPNNIMLLADGSSKLIDFGLSVHYNLEGRPSKSSISGAYTPGYAPVEQMLNTITTFSPQTDVYALGATLLYCLTGKHPKSAPEIHSSDALAAIASSALAPAITRALAERQTDRTPSATALLDSIEEALGSIPTKYKPSVDTQLIETKIKEKQSAPDVEEPHTKPNDFSKEPKNLSLAVVEKQGTVAITYYIPPEPWLALPEKIRDRYEITGLTLGDTERGFFIISTADSRSDSGSRLFPKSEACDSQYRLPEIWQIDLMAQFHKNINSIMDLLGREKLGRFYWMKTSGSDIGAAYLSDSAFTELTDTNGKHFAIRNIIPA